MSPSRPLDWVGLFWPYPFDPEQAHELGLQLVAAWGKYHVEPVQVTAGAEAL